MLAGISVALAIHAWREMNVDVGVIRRDHTLVLAPRGVMWFASAPLFRQRMGELLAEHTDADALTIDLAGLGRVDLTGASILRSVARGATEAGMEVTVRGASRQAHALLARVMPEWIG